MTVPVLIVNTLTTGARPRLTIITAPHGDMLPWTGLSRSTRSGDMCHRFSRTAMNCQRTYTLTHAITPYAGLNH